MSPALLQDWSVIKEQLLEQQRARPSITKTLAVILELKAAPLLHVARLTARSPQEVSQEFTILEQLKLVEGLRQNDPFEAYYRLTPTALLFFKNLWELQK